MSKSPFPGMDPYMEQSWRDVHHKLCTYACDDIQGQLSHGMIARVDERLMVELSPEQSRSIYPDVRVIRRERPRPQVAVGNAESGTVTALAEPLTLEIDDETATEAFIEIIDARSGGRMITVIEFISITNKLPGEGRDIYRRKQLELRSATVSTVEINLLRRPAPAQLSAGEIARRRSHGVPRRRASGVGRQAISGLSDAASKSPSSNRNPAPGNRSGGRAGFAIANRSCLPQRGVRR